MEPGDLASIIFTNSTAVDPKGALHTHRNFIANLLGLNHHLPVTESDQLLSVLPLSHALEFTCGFLMSIYGGATVTYVHSLKPKVILESMQETGTTCMLGVPTLYALIRDDIERRILRTPKSPLKSNLLNTSKRVSLSVDRALGQKHRPATVFPFAPGVWRADQIVCEVADRRWEESFMTSSRCWECQSMKAMA